MDASDRAAGSADDRLGPVTEVTLYGGNSNSHGGRPGDPMGLEVENVVAPRDPIPSALVGPGGEHVSRASVEQRGNRSRSHSVGRGRD